MHNLLTTLKQLVIDMQRKSGVVMQKGAKPVDGSLLTKKGNSKQDLEREELKGGADSKDNKPTDGFWVKLQDWSTCSLKCGGGTQSYHRVCVPPKKGGKPCAGQPELIKKCNEQPCPVIKKEDKGKGAGKNSFKPKIKVMPFSSRYQRYSVSFLFFIY
jgi:hypothetical protein